VLSDDKRPQLKPVHEESQDPAVDPDVLAADHPFAALVGHDPTIMKGMGLALRVLRDAAKDDKARSTLAGMTDGALDFRAGLATEEFSQSFGPGPEEMGEPGTRPGPELPEDVREHSSQIAQQLLSRLVDPTLLDRVRAALDPDGTQLPQP